MGSNALGDVLVGETEVHRLVEDLDEQRTYVACARGGARIDDLRHHRCHLLGAEPARRDVPEVAADEPELLVVGRPGRHPHAVSSDGVEPPAGELRDRGIGLKPLGKRTAALRLSCLLDVPIPLRLGDSAGTPSGSADVAVGSPPRRHPSATRLVEKRLELPARRAVDDYPRARLRVDDALAPRCWWHALTSRSGGQPRHGPGATSRQSLRQALHERPRTSTNPRNELPG